MPQTFLFRPGKGKPPLPTIFFVALGDLFPIYEVPKFLDVFGPAVPVVDVVGMFPDVAGEERDVRRGKRRRRVRSGNDREGAVRFFYEPRPTRAEGLECGFGKFRFEGLERSKIPDDGFQKASRRFSSGIRREGFEIERVVPDLRRVIENGSRSGGPYDFFKGFRFEFRSGYEAVQIVDVGLMVLPMVDFEGFFRYPWRKRVGGVRKGAEFEGHVR